MPYTRIQIKGSTIGNIAVESFMLDRGRLKAVSGSLTADKVWPNVHFLNIGLCDMPYDANAVLSSLCSGFIEPHKAIGWTGDIPLESNMGLFVEARFFSAYIALISFLVEH